METGATVRQVGNPRRALPVAVGLLLCSAAVLVLAVPSVLSWRAGTDASLVLIGLVVAVALGGAGIVVLRSGRAPARAARDLAPALVATLVGGLLVALKELTWALEILAARRLVHDQDAWGGAAPDPGIFSTWDFAVSRVSHLIPSAVAALLVAVTWWPAWHRRTQAAWVLAATTIALAAVGVVWQ